jgi:hypothetical protein
VKRCEEVCGRRGPVIKTGMKRLGGGDARNEMGKYYGEGRKGRERAEKGQRKGRELRGVGRINRTIVGSMNSRIDF